MRTKKIYDLDQTVSVLSSRLGEKKFIIIDTISGGVIIEPNKCPDPYDPIISKSLIDSMNRKDYYFKIPDMTSMSMSTKTFVAAELVSRMMLQESFRAMPFQAFIDALTITYLEENLNIYGFIDDIIDDFCKTLDKKPSCATIELARHYWRQRFEAAYRIIMESHKYDDIITDALGVVADNYRVTVMAILYMIKCDKVAE